MIRILYFAFICAFFAGTGLHSQSVFDLGQGSFDNQDFGVDGAYSVLQRTEKSQSIILATEMINAGMSTGYISGLGFFVDQLAPGNNFTLTAYRMSIGNASGPMNITFQTGLTEVVPSATHSLTAGYNVHSFSSPFLWNGTSDLIVETCYENANGGGGPGNNGTLIRFSAVTDMGYSESDHNSNDSACDDVNAETGVNGRPDLRLLWESAEIPPVADFAIGTFAACSGNISLMDNSSNIPDSWLWYFGDGSTSSEESPSYTYTSDGTYTISLVVSNAYGADSVAIDDAVTVALSGITPLPASCVPTSQDPSLGFGLLSVSLAGDTYTSSTGNSEYEDFTCELFTLDQGVAYTLNVAVGGGSINQVTAWIDYNADGIFTLNERFMNQQVNGTGSVTFTPSINALADSTLRMRIQGDFYLIGTQGPCANLTGGQAEDYSIRIVSNTEAPTASFTLDPEFSCDGMVQFRDESENVPTSWFWLFGDGSFSTTQHPSHTYTESGTYDVTSTAQNSFGNDDTLMTSAIIVDLSQALTPACAVQTSAFCCGYGILSVNLNGTINASANASVGYEDFSCAVEISVTEGTSFSFSSNTGEDSPQDVAVFIDFDNNGAFGIAERVFISNNAFTHAGTILIPGSVPVVDTRLRMRVIADFVGNNTTGCANQQFGQAEDYAIIILPDLTLPTADFSAAPLFSCDGEIDFMNASSSNSTGFVWYFGDGSMSTETEPTYTYLTEGLFTVSLVAINDNGQDSSAFFEYIEIDFEGVCDTAVMATNGSLPNLTSCEGYLADDGGPNGNYSSNSNGLQTIETTTGNLITLSFISFAFQQGNDYLYIYDGPDLTAPLIGQYSGTTPPNGGTVSSTGNTITLRQTSNFFSNFSGFLLSWECSAVGLLEYEQIHVGIIPNPASDYLQIENYSELGVKAMSVIDLQGRVVLRPSTNTLGIIELELLEAGNYILLLDTENSTIPVRFIVKR